MVAGDAVYVGTDNARRMNPAYQENAGVLVAFHAKDGKFLWQDVPARGARPQGVAVAFDDECALCRRQPVALRQRRVSAP